MNRFIILLLAISLFGCSKSVDIQLEPQAQMFLSKDIKQQVTITKQDAVYVALNDWLRTHQAGWYATSGRFPGGVYIKSGNYGFQVIESKVVIYSTLGNEPKAIYIQEINKGELSTILNLAK
ncbi:hypothetical protein [Colwellia hornerae]|uniref:Lipoprotein n=1 Tax=Colwellia hornerae TaxID=89402 RepID=A0A5C6Q3S4_9GAMM|nr:hypothetical protein [Colwellia hornerae]TWX47205.1 hypothetical protein ESZ28_17740 [Colwellia hornerae]TWX54507.1 hypothetical protein ESZ26_17710 [Colwellia hornerae]TWX63287.1 hypothetical protein ESZ27_17295 [Colwellia hornerae]